MPKRIYTPTEKAAALNLYETDGPTAVERQLGIPKETVNSWARKTNTRTLRTGRTHEAIAARQADLKLRRAVLSARFLDEAEALLSRVRADYTVYAFGGRDGNYSEHVMPLPPAGDARSLMQAATYAARQHVDLVAVDSDAGSSDAKSLLTDLGKALGIGVSAGSDATD